MATFLLITWAVLLIIADAYIIRIRKQKPSKWFFVSSANIVVIMSYLVLSKLRPIAIDSNLLSKIIFGIVVLSAILMALFWILGAYFYIRRYFLFTRKVKIKTEKDAKRKVRKIFGSDAEKHKFNITYGFDATSEMNRRLWKVNFLNSNEEIVNTMYLRLDGRIYVDIPSFNEGTEEDKFVIESNFPVKRMYKGKKLTFIPDENLVLG